MIDDYEGQLAPLFLLPETKSLYLVESDEGGFLYESPEDICDVLMTCNYFGSFWRLKFLLSRFLFIFPISLKVLIVKRLFIKRRQHNNIFIVMC